MPLPSLHALRHRNFRLFLGGQIFALIGYWIQMVAQSWLLYLSITILVRWLRNQQATNLSNAHGHSAT